jgi:hypothetical protein
LFNDPSFVDMPSYISLTYVNLFVIYLASVLVSLLLSSLLIRLLACLRLLFLGIYVLSLSSAYSFI